MINSMLCEIDKKYVQNEDAGKHIYHNTKKLLELYSIVSWRISTSMDELNFNCKENTGYQLDEIFESLIDLDPRINESRLKSRLRSLEESKSILKFIDATLVQLKAYPRGGAKFYNILYDTYIDRKAESIEGMAEIFNISRSTMYRNLNKAIEAYSVILWGYMIDELGVEADKAG